MRMYVCNMHIFVIYNINAQGKKFMHQICVKTDTKNAYRLKISSSSFCSRLSVVAIFHFSLSALDRMEEAKSKDSGVQ